MKIIKKNIEYKGEKYRAVIKTGVFITVKLYKTNKFFLYLETMLITLSLQTILT